MPDFLKSPFCRLGFLLILTTIVYGSTLTNGFVWDDTPIIATNSLLENPANIPQFFLSEDTINEDPTGYYRPVTYISFTLDRSLWGVNPAGYHLTNLLLHLLVTLLFYAVTAAMFNKERLAFLAALIFALHPMAGETVNFLSGGRNTLLSACFALLSLLFYLRNRQILALASFTVAIFSKEFALLLPVVFLLHDYLRQQVKTRSRWYILYLIPIACYLTLRSVAVKKANFLSGINMTDTAMAPILMVRYAVNMILPVQLKVLYDIKFCMAVAIVCLAGLVAMTVAVYAFRKYQELLFSACWFLLFLLPVINIIPMPVTSVIADRYAYFSLMGFALFLAAVINRWDWKGVPIGVAILCSVYSFIDISRNGFWKNDIRFFTRMTKDAPQRFIGYRNLGLSYYREGDIAPALHSLEVADSKLDISAKNLISDAYVFWKENRLSTAEKTLLRALELEPANPEPYLLLILMFDRDGNKAQSDIYRDKAHKLYPKIEELMTSRVVDLCRSGEKQMFRQQYRDAEVLFWQALKIDPDYIPALIDMGSLKAEQGKPAQAIPYLMRVLTLDPSNAAAHYNLSMIYKMQGRIADAQKEMERFRNAEATSKLKGGDTGP